MSNSSFTTNETLSEHMSHDVGGVGVQTELCRTYAPQAAETRLQMDDIVAP